MNISKKTTKYLKSTLFINKLIKYKTKYENILTHQELVNFLSLQRQKEAISTKDTIKSIIIFLAKENILKKWIFNFKPKRIIRYTFKQIPIYPILISLKKNSFFSHYTASYLYGLTEQIPKTIYLNVEQPPKPKNKLTLKQERIDTAFKNKTRISNNYIELNDNKIFMLNGMYTNQTGIIKFAAGEYSNYGEITNTLFVTNIERTLIDITVRPEYAGGIFEVLNAYKRAKNLLSVNTLTAILKQLDYVYPYYQAIGFYLEKAGYSKKQLELLEQFDIKYNFYLVHQMKEVEFSQKWRLFYPKGFA